jgi:hypothetical protein
VATIGEGIAGSERHSATGFGAATIATAHADTKTTTEPRTLRSPLLQVRPDRAEIGAPLSIRRAPAIRNEKDEASGEELAEANAGAQRPASISPNSDHAPTPTAISPVPLKCGDASPVGWHSTSRRESLLEFAYRRCGHTGSVEAGAGSGIGGSFGGSSGRASAIEGTNKTAVMTLVRRSTGRAEP